MEARAVGAMVINPACSRKGLHPPPVGAMVVNPACSRKGLHPPPVGAMFVSPALQRGVCFNSNQIQSRRDDAQPLPKYITLIVLNSVIAKKCDKFLFKITFSMMFLLVLDVSLHHRNLRRTHAECSVSFLPGKSLSHPPGRTSLEFLNRMSKGVSCRQDKQQMNVIRRSACGDKRETLATRDAAQIGIEFDRARGRYERTAIFGAEYTMNEIARVCVRHRTPSLWDSQITTAIPFPTLKRGANKHCACGAPVLCSHAIAGVPQVSILRPGKADS